MMDPANRAVVSGARGMAFPLRTEAKGPRRGKVSSHEPIVHGAVERLKRIIFTGVNHGNRSRQILVRQRTADTQGVCGKQPSEKSGSLLMNMFGKGDRRFKFDNDLVTEADNAAWNLISSKIKGTFEGHGFLREMSRDELTSESCPRFLWIVDSLDGAASFQAGMPVWGVSAALFEKFWPVMGFLYLPVTGELYSAYAGREALLNDEPIFVREDPGVNNESVVLVYSRFHQDFTSNFPGKVRNFGSSAGHMAYVARGTADACFVKNVSVQDLAAGSVILEAAGGEIRYLDGRRFLCGATSGRQTRGRASYRSSQRAMGRFEQVLSPYDLTGLYNIRARVLLDAGPAHG